jgi:polyisoprenoid-binding protein YceI
MRRCALAGLLALLPLAAPAQPVVYRLDPAHTHVWFEVLHFGTSTLRGRFGPVVGEVVLDRTAGRGELGLRIATAGIDTGVPALDARLRAADLLDSAGSPEAYFVASQFRFDGDRLLEVQGEFTLRGVGQPLTLQTLRFSCRPDPVLQTERCGGDFEAELRRSDFGAVYGLPFVADRVHLLIEVEGLRAGPP